MRKTIILAIAALGLLAAAPTGLSLWRLTAAVQPPAKPTDGLWEVACSEDLLEEARPDLADLRIVDENLGEQVARAIHRPEATTRVVVVDGQMRNLGRIPSQKVVATVRFAKAIPKNSIQISTTGENFKRRVRIDASDDGRAWHVVRDGGYLVDLAGEPRLLKDTVGFPTNDQLHLRVTVFYDPEDPPVVSITRVRAHFKEIVPGVRSERALKLVDRIEDAKEKETRVQYDFGYANVRVNELALKIDGENFFRRVTLYGRDAATRMVEKRREDGSLQRREEDVPWQRVDSGFLFRFTSDGDVEEDVTLNAHQKHFRFWQLRIANEDNPPLTVTEARAAWAPTLVQWPAKADGRYTLYLGRADAETPSYDLPHFIDRLRKDGIARAKLAPAEPNPTYRTADEGPGDWSERYRALIWVALLAALAVLAWLAVSQIKRLGPPPPDA